MHHASSDRSTSRFRHFVFVLPQDISQVFDFLVDAVQHLPHRVHLHVPTFELFQCKPDGQVLRQLHQHALIQFFVLPLLGQPRERISQRLLRLARQLRHLILKFHRGRGWIRARSNAPKRRQRPQDSIDRFVIRASKHPAAGTCPFSDTTAKPRAPPWPASDSRSTRCPSQTPAAPARAAYGSNPPAGSHAQARSRTTISQSASSAEPCTPACLSSSSGAAYRDS